MPRNLVQLETTNTNVGATLTSSFEYKILQARSSPAAVPRGKNQLIRDNNALTDKLRKRQIPEKDRPWMKLLKARVARPDLSPRDIAKRIAITENEADALSARLKELNIPLQQLAGLGRFKHTEIRVGTNENAPKD